ncbi:hypothetical protein AKN92_11360 [Thiopseudomonas alkaliphila]|nr:hypothetical protein AKN92_11360 [Thiopseudomonas alkaliphila]
MIVIDWTQAPTSATHFDKDTGNFLFLKTEPYGFWCKEAQSWRLLPHVPEQDNLIEAPPRTDKKTDAPTQAKYEKYFIDVSGYSKIDIYRYLELLPGNRGHAIEHALKKLALCGVRTGGKSLIKDITEARDTLNRWLEMRAEDEAIGKTV